MTVIERPITGRVVRSEPGTTAIEVDSDLEIGAEVVVYLRPSPGHSCAVFNGKVIERRRVLVDAPMHGLGRPAWVRQTSRSGQNRPVLDDESRAVGA